MGNTPKSDAELIEQIEQILSMVWNDAAMLAGGAYLGAPHYGLVKAVPKIMTLLRKDREAVARVAVDTFEHRINCDTLISELSGWPSIVAMAKEETLRILNQQKQKGGEDESIS